MREKKKFVSAQKIAIFPLVRLLQLVDNTHTQTVPFVSLTRDQTHSKNYYYYYYWHITFHTEIRIFDSIHSDEEEE